MKHRCVKKGDKFMKCPVLMAPDRQKKLASIKLLLNLNQNGKLMTDVSRLGLHTSLYTNAGNLIKLASLSLGSCGSDKGRV